jgi:hypothetical protein
MTSLWATPKLVMRISEMKQLNGVGKLPIQSEESNENMGLLLLPGLINKTILLKGKIFSFLKNQNYYHFIHYFITNV